MNPVVNDTCFLAPERSDPASYLLARTLFHDVGPTSCRYASGCEWATESTTGGLGFGYLVTLKNTTVYFYNSVF